MLVLVSANRVCPNYPFVAVIASASNLTLKLDAHHALQLRGCFLPPRAARLAFEPGNSATLLIQLLLPLLESTVANRPPFRLVTSSVRVRVTSLHVYSRSSCTDLHTRTLL